MTRPAKISRRPNMKKTTEEIKSREKKKTTVGRSSENTESEKKELALKVIEILK